jgi:hypothetical protein
MAASDALSPEEAHRRMVDRIEDALTRIDIATRNRADALTTLEQRHDVLRDQMTRAIAALDTVLAAADAADTAEAAADDVDEGDA